MTLPSPRLPVTVEFHGDETPLSFLSRVAKSNGFQSTVEFCEVVGLDKLKVRSGDERTLLELEAWTGVSASRLARFAIGPGRMLSFSGQALRRHQMFTVGMRFCPACVADDVNDAAGRKNARPHLRASHILKVVVDCPAHGLPLQYRPYEIEFGDDLAGDKIDIDEPSGSRLVRIPHPANAYFASRICGPSGSDFLDTIPAYLAVELCEVLGEFDCRACCPTPPSIPAHDLDCENLFFRGFDIAKNGLPAISNFLSDHVRTAIRQGRKIRGIYSPAWRWLRGEIENPHYGPLIDFFRSHALAHIPISSGEPFYTPGTTRRFHTVRSASKEFDISESQVISLLEQSGELIDANSAIGSQLVDQELLWSLLPVDQRLLTAVEAASYIGCTVKQVEILVKNGMLKCLARGLRSRNGRGRFTEPEVLSFLKRLLLNTSKTTHTPDMINVFTATRVCSIPFVDVVNLVFHGRLRRIACASGTDNLASLLVDPMEILDLLEFERAERT
ncbi:TniQ family protein [Rhizobium sp. 2YAF20]|uniref:TniQ family protein n=1 Tax=Rhizobium sp. 2YAF20 TaxID=3233027 RepID=UPI003F9AC292